jgi:uncharacterized membrane protein YhaH (DUF805 family)
MGNIIGLYTSFDGRIGRKTWWLASIALAVIIAIIEFAILPVLGLSAMASMAALTAAPGTDPAAASAALAASIQKGVWASLIVTVIFALPALALGVKRRHDRDNNGLDFVVFYAIVVVLDLVQALGLGYTTTTLPSGISIPAPSMPLTIINMLLGIFGIYLLVVLGFLRGRAGANQYGPDPLNAGAMATA